MPKKLLQLLLIFFDFTLLFIMLFLTYRIYKISIGQSKERHISNIRKEDIFWDSNNENLKYFYEPKPDTITIWNPEWLSKEIKSTINHDSLHTIKNYSYKKGENTYRIITLGDSYTYGQYVSDNANFSTLLEYNLNSRIKCKSVKNFEIINLGVPGYDFSYTVQRFIKRGITFSPDLIFWLIPEEDIARINEFQIPKMLELRDKGTIDYDNKTNQYLRYKEAIDIISKELGENKILNYQVIAFNQFPKSFQSKLVILLFPPKNKQYNDLFRNFLSKIDYQNIHTFEFNYWQDEFLDLRLADGHPNSRGHQMIAESLLKYLRTRYLDRC